MNETTQESAARQHNGAARNPATVFHDNRRDPIIGHFNIESITLNNRQVFNRIDFTLHRLSIKPSIGLCARPANSGTLLAIEHAELDTRRIGNAAHQTVQRIDLTDEMPLAEAANSGVTGHHANRLALVGYKGGFCAMPCSCGCGFAARVTTTNYNDIE
ncbi:hypothetical protein J2861_004143 [Agrobacterium tumefaciens]|nr:hypothetical protein [Agrobacterium tumefaciens]MDP9857192.1 hypothetical protein [Agrobacterium tumefaciens]